jgi:hypothetical protein
VDPGQSPHEGSVEPGQPPHEDSVESEPALYTVGGSIFIF